METSKKGGRCPHCPHPTAQGMLSSWAPSSCRPHGTDVPHRGRDSRAGCPCARPGGAAPAAGGERGGNSVAPCQGCARRSLRSFAVPGPIKGSDNQPPSASVTSAGREAAAFFRNACSRPPPSRLRHTQTRLSRINSPTRGPQRFKPLCSPWCRAGEDQVKVL